MSTGLSPEAAAALQAARDLLRTASRATRPQSHVVSQLTSNHWLKAAQALPPKLRSARAAIEPILPALDRSAVVTLGDVSARSAHEAVLAWGEKIIRLLCAVPYLRGAEVDAEAILRGSQELVLTPDDWERVKQLMPTNLPSQAEYSALELRLQIELEAGPRAQTADCAHSDDFRTVRWCGQEYSFTPGQARCIKVLWEHWERGTPEVAEGTILNMAGLDSDRLYNVFNRGKRKDKPARNHPAWDTMIASGTTKGTFRLAGAKTGARTGA